MNRCSHPGILSSPHGLPTVLECSLYHKTIKVNTTDITIAPVADVQLGARGIDVDGLREHLEYVAAMPNPRILGVGDYLDPVSPSNRKLLRAAFVKGDLYDSFEDLVKDGMMRLVDQFVDLVNVDGLTWDAILGGHHYYTYADRGVEGTWYLRTTDWDIADRLNAVFLGDPDEKQAQAMITYSFPPPKKGDPRPELKVFLRHGQGNGETFAAPLNQLEKQMRAHVADVYIIGHHHKLVAGGVSKLEEDPNHETNLHSTDGRLVSAGSWMRGFLKNHTTYAEDGQMIPLAMGAPIIKVHRKDDGTFRVRVEV